MEIMANRNVWFLQLKHTIIHLLDFTRCEYNTFGMRLCVFSSNLGHWS